jgi:chromosome segregation ATPase
MGNMNRTYVLAYECCDRVIEEDGKFPTIESIRTRIGVNSPNTIKKAIDDWSLHFIKKNLDRIKHPEIPTALIDAAESIWKLALEQSETAYQERAMQLAQKESEWQASKQALEKSLADQQRSWNSEKDRLQTDIQLKAGSIDALEGKVSQLADKLEIAEKALSEERQNLSRTEGALAEAKAAMESKTKEWEDRFGKEHIWHLNRIEQEKNALRELHEKEVSRLQRHIEAIKAEQSNLQTRHSEFLNKVGESLKRQSKLESELERMKEKLAGSEQKLAAEKEKNKALQGVVKRQRKTKVAKKQDF